MEIGTGRGNVSQDIRKSNVNLVIPKYFKYYCNQTPTCCFLRNKTVA